MATKKYTHSEYNIVKEFAPQARIELQKMHKSHVPNAFKIYMHILYRDIRVVQHNFNIRRFESVMSQVFHKLDQEEKRENERKTREEAKKEAGFQRMLRGLLKEQEIERCVTGQLTLGLN